MRTQLSSCCCWLLLMASTVLRTAHAFRSPISRRLGLSQLRGGPAFFHRRGGGTLNSRLAPVSASRAMATSSDDQATASKVKLALCQILVGDDKASNIAAAREAVVKAAKEHGAQIVALPECWNSPYATSSFPVYSEAIPTSAAQVDGSSSPSLAMLLEVARTCNIYLIGGSIPERQGDRVFNTCVIVSPEGEILAKHRKVHLFDIDVPGKITFKESDTLSAGDTVTVIQTPYGPIGVGICYDIRFPELSMLMRKRGCKLLIFPGAFNLTTGPAHWELLQRARAVDNQVYVAAVSPARSPGSGYQAWGHSSVVSPWGEVVATTGHEAAMVVAEVDLESVEEVRRNIPVSMQKRHDLYDLREMQHPSS